MVAAMKKTPGAGPWGGKRKEPLCGRKMFPNKVNPLVSGPAFRNCAHL